MSAVWVYLIFWLLVGPEISQKEREERSEEVLYIEKMRNEQLNFASIGERTAAMNEAEHIENGELGKGATAVMRNSTSDA
jgi:SHS family lactate transporter-like MFS transporter